MKKGQKILLLIFTLLIPIIIFSLYSGFYDSLFFNSMRPQNLTQLLNSGDPNRIFNSISAQSSGMQFFRISSSIFVLITIIVTLIYLFHLMKTVKETENKIFWLIIFFISAGIGFLFYFFKYIWKEEPQKQEVSPA